jgi:chromosomal replication initiator protein
MSISVDTDSLESRFFEALNRRVPRQAFDTWFRPLQIRESSDTGVVLFSAPNPVLKDWVTSHYGAALQASLREVMPDVMQIEWAIENPAAQVATVKSEVLRSTTQAAARVSVSQDADTSDGLLNPRYTFSNFVVASCNQFAHAASEAVADSPGKTYNPLYLYGGVGLGKTHLMQAIGHSIRRCNPSLAVSYTSLEGFMNELINAIRYGYDKTHAFRERYRSIDVLLVDDIQFIAGKERTQEEFFHTFNALYDSQKQIVISSDCPPRSIPDIEERLHSRFEWGLIADIEPPDLETKVAILRRKADLQGVSVPDDVALYIAGAV